MCELTQPREIVSLTIVVTAPITAITIKTCGKSKIKRCLREGFEDSPVDVQDDAEGLEDQPLQRLLRGLVLSKWEIIKGNTIGRSISIALLRLSLS